MTKQNIIYAGSLIGVFLVLVILGRLIFENAGDNNATSGSSTPANGSAGVYQTGGAGENGNSASTSGASGALSAIATCANALAQKTAQNGTQYATGTILAVFNSDVSLDEASATLVSYNFSIENGSNPEDTYSSYHLVTAAVPAGGEFNAICELEADSRVHSASLNTLFSLHE